MLRALEAGNAYLRSNAGLADFWYCQAEKEMFGFVIRDKQTNIFSATQEASIP